MVNITVNGKALSVNENSTILEACSANKIRIPTLCYLKQINEIGSCRICMVEIEGYKNLFVACRTKVQEGMVITTESEKLTSYRKHMLELILSNHKVDCLNCARNGMCQLQELCNEYDIKDTEIKGSRRHIEDKLPRLDSNPYLSYDPSKCIHCMRCISMCNRAAVNGALQTGRSGLFKTIEAPFGENWKSTICESCGNCATACPTGALTVKRKRKYRSWETKKVLTTCPHCATGCQFYLVVRDNKIVDVEAADGPSNHGLLCVKGRNGSFDFVHSPDRITTPLIKNRETGKFEPATWEEAISYTAKRLMEIKEKYGNESLAGFACSRSANEDVYMVQKMVRTCFGNNNTDNCIRFRRHDESHL